MSGDEHMKEIMRMVEDSASASINPWDSPNEMIFLWACPNDFRQLPQELAFSAIRYVATVFHSLKGLKGKTIKEVVLDDSKNADPNSSGYNPFGNRFSIKVITE